MPNFGNYPPAYLLFNAQTSKQLVIVMKIEGIPGYFGINPAYTVVRYGDPGIYFGLPDLVYGALRPTGGLNNVGGVKPWMIMDSGLTIQQRIEPEQGKGNVGTLTITLLDYQQQVSFFIAPGNVVDEIMGGKQVTIYMGFTQISFPEDYAILYRGYITSLDTPPAAVKFQISDASMKSRQPIYSTSSTILTSPVDSSQTNIPVVSSGGFYQAILGPDGSYDSIVHPYLVVDSEIMEYGPTDVTPTSFTVTRGSVGSVPVEHEIGAQVSNSLYLGFPTDGAGENFITLALKFLLSGWGGPCETDIGVLSLGETNGNPANSFVLLTETADLDLGLTVGDYFYITDAADPSNNISGKITGFADTVQDQLKVVLTDTPFPTPDPLTIAVAAFRSKYDTLPVAAGSSCRMRDVDVQTMEYVRSTYFSAGIYSVAIYNDSPVFALDTIAADLFLPFGCYQISRFGRISMSVTKPPLPGIGNLIELSWNNVLDPDKIHVQRALNNRTFYNVVSYEYDYDVVNQTFNSIQYFVATDSLNQFQQTLALPIQARALHSVFGAGAVGQSRGAALLNRYKDVALMLEMTVNWQAGSLIEVSDVVLLNDDGHLQIMNFQTGERNLGSQLFEVIDRTFNIAQGNVKLKLLGGLGFSVNSRFGLISPSSHLNSGSTSTVLRLVPSYGQTSVGLELSKWSTFFGLPIRVHNPDYTLDGTSLLVGNDPTDTTALDIDPPLGFTPDNTCILEIANYPTDTNKNTNQKYKTLYAYYNPTVPIVSGASTTQFDVDIGQIPLFTVGNLLIVRKGDWSEVSQEVKLSDITGTTLTVSEPLENQFAPFGPITPDSTYVVDGIGFKDGGGYYRYD